MSARAVSERTIVLLVGAVQFVNILEFMIVMPLGPDFAKALDIPTSHLGYIGGSYTAAAAVAGLVGSMFLDRFDRRSALAVAMLGLVAGTAAGGLAWDLPSLLAARVIAGTFGGPATSLAMSIIADVIPPERRGKAISAVMTSFSIASVIGVPTGLELARIGSWRTPFLVVAGSGLVLGMLAIFLLPPLRGHIQAAASAPKVGLFDLFRRKNVLVSYSTTAALMFASFILIPNFSTYFQFNLGYPREQLGLLYLVGGAVNFFTLRLVGHLVDRHGAARVGSFGVAFVLLVTFVGFYHPVAQIPVMVLFVAFMMSTSFRNVAYNSLATRVPESHERARFMSIQSTVQHLASAAGSVVSAGLLVERPDHGLEGMPTIALISLLACAVLPFLFHWTEAMLLARERAAGAHAARS
ncbi:MFS transporter [Myxococcota bacterium]|nr:MFS transporter [Myxococcota bacterium]